MQKEIVGYDCRESSGQTPFRFDGGRLQEVSDDDKESKAAFYKAYNVHFRNPLAVWLSGRGSYALFFSGILIAVATLPDRIADGTMTLIGPLSAVIYVSVRISRANIDWNGFFSGYE